MCRKIYTTVCHAHATFNIYVEFSHSPVVSSFGYFLFCFARPSGCAGVRHRSGDAPLKEQDFLAHAVASSRAPWLIRDRGWPGMIGEGVEE